jgi:RNase H-fold protein (predicted Holliday junction resolvase)
MSAIEASSPLIFGFDPGRDKCGVAVVSLDGQVHIHEVVPAEEAIAKIQVWMQQYAIHTLVMGNQTTAKQWQARLTQSLSIPILLIDERFSTLEARDRYWVMYPPKGLTRLIPQGMRDVPRPIDDIVAIILVERYLAQQAKAAAS